MSSIPSPSYVKHPLYRLFEGLICKSSNENIAMLGGGWGGRSQSALDPFLGAYSEGDSNSKLQSDIYRLIEKKQINKIILASKKSAPDVEFRKHLLSLLDISLV
jgi:hypothetical protein